MSTKLWLPIAAVLLLAGCAGQRIKLNAEDQRALASQPNVYAVHHHPGVTFVVESTAVMLFAPLAAGIMVAEGMAMQRDLKLADLAPRVKERLVRTLESELKLANVRVVPDIPQNTSVETLKKLFEGGLVLVVQTRNWGIDNYRAEYSARVRLVRLSDATVLWEAACNDAVPDKGKPAPPREELVANGGELLKAKLALAADQCASELAGWLTQKAP